MSARTMSLQTSTSEPRLHTLCSRNAAAGLTAEEKAAREVRVTAVKDACYDAVGKFVLHMHDFYLVKGPLGAYQQELDVVQIQKVMSG